jgi:hypothetical protein
MTSERAPHENLYTRLQAGADGIGVFAIRDIPEGTVLFAGDMDTTTRVLPSKVENIDDEEIRRMYVEFCPMIEGAFVAPKDFNKMTMGWYLNHSDNPNVASDKSLRFTTTKFIAKGEELRTDYRVYSDNAAELIASWRDGGTTRTD